MTTGAGASVHAGVAAGVAGDTCDTYAPVSAAMEVGRAGERASSVNEGEPASRGPAAKRPKTRSRPVPRPLLDYVPSRVASRGSSSVPSPDVGAFERRARWELLACLHPALEAARSTSLGLFSLTLTAAHVDMFGEAARHFAKAIVSSPREGLLVALEPGEERGRPHYHGVVLIGDPAILVEQWAEFAGRRARPPKATPIERWADYRQEVYERAFAPHLLRVVQYACAPWPPGTGARSVDGDYIASGSFLAPLRAFQARMLAPVLSEAQGAGMPPQASPMCRLCGEPLPPGRRTDMRRHPTCRRRASKAKRRAERAAEHTG